jgi:hypothetical protein
VRCKLLQRRELARSSARTRARSDAQSIVIALNASRAATAAARSRCARAARVRCGSSIFYGIDTCVRSRAQTLQSKRARSQYAHSGVHAPAARSAPQLASREHARSIFGFGMRAPMAAELVRFEMRANSNSICAPW